MIRHSAAATALIAVLGLISCAPATPSIAWDVDNCDYCRMTVSDQRFGAAAITSGGRTLHFDSIECLAAWASAQPKPPRELWIADAQAPGMGASFGNSGSLSSGSVVPLATPGAALSGLKMWSLPGIPSEALTAATWLSGVGVP